MASSMNFTLISFFVCSLFIQSTLADVICEKLPANLCAFVVASSGQRCVLENYKNEEGTVDYVGDVLHINMSNHKHYTCKSSEVIVDKFSSYIETDHCIKSCGVDRTFVGISSDAFFTPEFTASLCSPACYQNCPNVVDLYFNLAAGEGVFLPSLCEKQRSSPHRAMFEVLSSSGGAAAVDSDDEFPAPAPF